MPTQNLSTVLSFGGKTLRSFKSSVDFTTKGIDKIGKSITKNTKKQAELRKEMKRYVKAGKVVNSQYFVAKQEIDRLSRSTERLERRQRRLRHVSNAVGGAMRKIGRIGKRVFQGLAIASSAAVVGLANLFKKTADYGDELAKTSRRLGITVESLEELRFIAERSGVEIPVLEKSIQKVQIALGEAARNTKGPYAQAFKELGINFRQFGKLKPEEQIEELARQFGKLTSQTERTYLANRIFGEEGIKIIQILEAGGDGVASLRDRFHELSGSMGTDGAMAAEAFNDSLTDLKQQVGGTFRLIAVEAMPAATKAMDEFRKQIASGDIDVKAIGESLAVLITLFGKAARAALGFADTLQKFGGFLGDNLADVFGQGAGESYEGGLPPPKRPRLSPATGITASGQPASQTNVYNITQQPGEDGQLFARRVAAASRMNQRKDAAADLGRTGTE